MSNYIRPKVPAAMVFCTVVLAHRGSSLLIDEIALLRVAAQKTKEERPFHIDAWVVLPDHMHFVWTLPDGDSDLGARIGAMKARFTRAVKASEVGWSPTLRRSPSKLRKGDGGIWQRRFWDHHIRNEEEYRAYVAYCHVNPVKHGLVERPEDWPYSTVQR